jgi:hypothetical protein
MFAIIRARWHTPALASCQTPQLCRSRFAAKEICRHCPSPKHGIPAHQLYHICASPEVRINKCPNRCGTALVDREMGVREGITVELSAADRTQLEAISNDRNSPQKHVRRARIVLLTARFAAASANRSPHAVSRVAPGATAPRLPSARGQTNRPRGLKGIDHRHPTIAASPDRRGGPKQNACTGRQPYPDARGQSVHRSSSITCRSVSELTSPRMRTRAPQPNAEYDAGISDIFCQHLRRSMPFLQILLAQSSR